MKNYNNLITKYKSQLEKDPRSKVFAPLAEIYRKVGMNDEALILLKRGLIHHPSFSAAVIIYGQLLLEQNEIEEAYTILRPQLSINGDNIKFLKLFAQSCFKQNLILEALNTYKRVLFISPKDIEASEFIVKYDNFDSVEDEDLTQKTFDISNLDDEIESWSTLSLVPQIKEEPVVEEKSKEESGLIFSHTLVDLYLKQGAKQKAIEVLNSALVENPDDTRVQDRLRELEGLDEISESKGREDLMAAFESTAKKLEEKPKVELEKLSMAFELFESYLKKRSSEVLNG
ncbi:anaphase-promoting complex, cyclosome, subunit 3 [Bacteriovorax sp. BAL6_X]|uniref:tetratricopeptide repeat protein n=1 Tax=Bacteriovorax sp. BAL6_X TaxID=1201290 RepID=UPI00038595F6|nr:CDC27 family protein [Bacteriovorax sp. BAL6_X]EPZ50501.1 anaphase-promoting complex, cyclosome, subunit 3 [Bacteriovorax sp. BAL6_X]